MLTRHFACLAILAVMCVLSVFMFPAAQGPFPVHAGPATVFRALRAYLLMLFGMMAAASLTAGAPGWRRLRLIRIGEGRAPSPRLGSAASPLLC
jgi:hypothetical protein